MENCKRLKIADLFRSKQIKFDATTTGTWNNIPWTTYLSDRGSTLTIANRTYELIPEMSRGSAEGVWWVIRDSTGQRHTTILLAPDGRIGSKSELGARYLSQVCWNKRRARAHQRRRIIERMEGATSFDWVVSHPNYVPRRPWKMSREVYEKLLARLEKYKEVHPSGGRGPS